jgi:2-keto-4-pentenoate hydratase
MPHAQDGPSDAIARTLVEARLAARALSGFPGELPATLAEAYAAQDRAIARWPTALAGWKVGYIAPERQEPGGDDRVTGPVFADRIWADQGSASRLPVIPGGFAAVEAEYIYRLGADADPDRMSWSPGDAVALVAALHIGVELAGSPMADINQRGPTAVVSDFGNNAGVILGMEIPKWHERSDDSLHCETWIEGHCVGRGGAGRIHGGLAGALAFALGRCARRGLPARAGMLITTGAATGIHDVRIGQQAELRFTGLGSIRCEVIQALPGSSGFARPGGA